MVRAAVNWAISLMRVTSPFWNLLLVRRGLRMSHGIMWPESFHSSTSWARGCLSILESMVMIKSLTQTKAAQTMLSTNWTCLKKNQLSWKTSIRRRFTTGMRLFQRRCHQLTGLKRRRAKVDLIRECFQLIRRPMILTGVETTLIIQVVTLMMTLMTRETPTIESHSNFCPGLKPQN